MLWCMIELLHYSRGRSMSQNPLLSDYHLPPFDRIQPTHIVEAIQQRIAACKTTIEQVLERGDFSWEGLVVPLEQVDDLLERSWSPVSHLNAVMRSEEHTSELQSRP